MADVPNEPINFEQYRRVELYRQGATVHAADLEGVTAPTIIARMKRETPGWYEKAKRELAAARNDKYRRVGALAVDIQLDTLEVYQEVLNAKEDGLGDEQINSLRKAQGEIRARVKDIAAIGESAEKRADLNEGKATERTELIGITGLLAELDGKTKGLPSD